MKKAPKESSSERTRQRSLITKCARRLPQPIQDAGMDALLACRSATSRFRSLPDFLIIGAQKAGTTSLFKYLLRHPNILRPHKKEIHYFDLNYERGLRWYRAHFPHELSKNAGDQVRITGEASPYYLFHPKAPQRAAETLNEPKLIVLLRNPVDRAYSHYNHEVRRGTENKSFREAIKLEKHRLEGEMTRVESGGRSLSHRNHSYVARGRYADQLERWFEHFPRDSFFIKSSEEFFTKTEQVMNQLFRFLHLPAHNFDEFPVYNQNKYDPIPKDVRQELEKEFEESNKRLEGLLQGRVEW